jgi:fatty-acid desaturase
MKSFLTARNLQALCLFATILGIYFWPPNVARLSALLAFYFLFLGFGIAIGFHRGLSHRLIPPDSFLMWFVLFWGTLTTLGRPIEWIAIHRYHHQKADTPQDPHSPLYQGFWNVFLNRWTLSSQTAHGGQSASVGISLARDLVRLHSVMFFQRRYFQVIGAYLVLIFLVAGPAGLIYAYAAPVTLCVLATSLVNSVCHWPSGARNCFWVNVATFGEGLHGTHHESPMAIDASHSIYFDLSGWVLSKLLKSEATNETNS